MEINWLWVKAGALAMTAVLVYGLADGNGYNRGKNEQLRDQVAQFATANKQLSDSIVAAQGQLDAVTVALGVAALQAEQLQQKQAATEKDIQNAIKSNDSWARSAVPSAVSGSLHAASSNQAASTAGTEARTTGTHSATDEARVRPSGKR